MSSSSTGFVVHGVAKRKLIFQGVRATTEEDENGISSDDEGSIADTKGVWEGINSAWNGCCCGNLHRRPIKVFWIQCEGPCQAWWCVSPNCVGFTEQQAQVMEWSCHVCRQKMERNNLLRLLLRLPDNVLYHILDYAARGEDKTRVLLQQISVLCSHANHSIKNKPADSLWSFILKQDYNTTTTTTSHGERRLTPKRRCRPALDAVKEIHCLIRSRTEDAHAALLAMADSQREPLTLARLKKLLGHGRQLVGSGQPKSPGSPSSTTMITTRHHKRSVDVRRRRPISQQSSPGSPSSTTTTDSSQSNCSHNDTSNQQRIFINQRSQFGRTFLHAVCAADYVNEGVVSRCVRHLLQDHGSDPNRFTTAEHPYANRPALFFAISRVMPKVVQEFIDAGAALDVQVTGKFRLVSDPSIDFEGTFTALEFARELQKAEANSGRSSQQPKQLPAYWMRKLSACISILSKAQSMDRSK